VCETVADIDRSNGLLVHRYVVIYTTRDEMLKSPMETRPTFNRSEALARRSFDHESKLQYIKLEDRDDREQVAGNLERRKHSVEIG